MNLTDIKQLLADEEAVSPVIGVILMVAITVILAAVIGTFVLGLGDNAQDSPPNVNFAFDYDTAAGTVDITHNGGQDFDAGNVIIQDDTGTQEGGSGTAFVSWVDSVSTGDTETFDYNDNAETIRIIWQSPAGGSSNTIGSSQVP